MGKTPPQKFDFPLTKPSYVGERLRPCKNRQKNQEKDFQQRIIYFARLTMIRQILERVKETRRLRNRCKLCSARTHHRPPLAPQWRTTDSALHPFVTDIFPRLPWQRRRGGLTLVVLSF